MPRPRPNGLAAVALVLALRPAAAQEVVTLDTFRSGAFKSEYAFNIWGDMRRPLLDGSGGVDGSAASGFECFSGAPAFDKCTIAPTYNVADHDPSSEASAVGYLADPGNWASGTLQDPALVDDAGLSPWCVSCCNNARTEFVFNETFAMQCPEVSNPEGWTSWTTELDAAVGSGVASDGDCTAGNPGGRTCDEALALFPLETCQTLEQDQGYNCDNCACGEPQGLGYAWWQFRFAQLRTLDSNELVTCDLKMPVADGVANYYGYSLTIVVVEHSEGGKTWRGVEKCHAMGIEAPMSASAEAWWQGLPDPTGNDPERASTPCWAGDNPTCLYQQITVTNQNEWCSDHYAVTGNVRGIYEAGLPDAVADVTVTLDSSPTFSELEGGQPLENDPGFAYTFEKVCDPIVVAATVTPNGFEPVLPAVFVLGGLVWVFIKFVGTQ